MMGGFGRTGAGRIQPFGYLTTAVQHLDVVGAASGDPEVGEARVHLRLPTSEEAILARRPPTVARSRDMRGPSKEAWDTTLNFLAES